MRRQKLGKTSNDATRIASAGFTLIELLVATAVLGIFSAGLASLMSQMFKFTRGNDIKSSLLNTKNQIISAIQIQSEWNNTVATIASAANSGPANPALVSGLLDTTIDSPADAWIPLPLLMHGIGPYDPNYLANGNVLIDVNPNNTTTPPLQRGYDVRGRKCNGFGVDTDGGGPGQGNDLCPFQWTVSWRPVCPGAYPCKAPGVHYKIDLAYLPGPALLNQSINSTSYSVTETPRNDPNYLANFCNQLLGTWTGTTCNFNSAVCADPKDRLMGVQITGVPPSQTVTPLCVPMLSGADNTSCPAGEKFVQLNADGSKVCQRNLAGASLPTCGFGQKLSSLNLDGSYTCVAVLDSDRGTCADGWKSSGNDQWGNPICHPTLDYDRGDCAEGWKSSGNDSWGNPQCQPTLDRDRLAGCGTGTKQNGNDSWGNPVCVPIFQNTTTGCPQGKVLHSIDQYGNQSCVYPECPNGWYRAGTDGNSNPICAQDSQHFWSAVYNATCNNCWLNNLGATACPVFWAGESTTATDMWFTAPGACTGVAHGFNQTCFALFGAAGSNCTTRSSGSGVYVDCHVDQFYFGNPAINTQGIFSCHHSFVFQ